LLDLREAVGERAVVPLAHRLRVELRVDELVADAAVRGHLDAGADLPRLRATRRRRLRVRRSRREQRLLPGEPDGVRIRDVVARGVERLLLREDAAQRGLQ